MIAETYTITLDTNFWNGVQAGWIAGALFMALVLWFLCIKKK